MKKRIIDLRDRVPPLLDIVSYGRGGRPLTPVQRAQIDLTVRRVPEVLVKVSGGARTVAGVKKHLSYIGREGRLGLETDFGERAEGQGFAHQLIEDWELGVDARPRQSGRSIQRRKPSKVVHNVIFSMPPGTHPERVLKAVRKLALNEWQWKHRYAMALHTDDAHPHVHVVLKAVSEDGKRLNIRKATLRSWRAQFAANLRELGVAANATERAVRGQSRVPKSDGIYRAAMRGESTHMLEREAQLLREAASGTRLSDPGFAEIYRTRQSVVAGWRSLEARLRESGDHELADDTHAFVDRMSPVQTENAMLAQRMLSRKRGRWTAPPGRTR